MTDFEAKALRVIHGRQVDGVRRAGEPAVADLDGYVSAKEADRAMQVALRDLSRARQSGSPTTALVREVQCLSEISRRAENEQRLGNQRGYAYMAEAFYRMDLDPRERQGAIRADQLGNRDGMATRGELAPGSAAHDEYLDRFGARAVARLTQKLPTGSRRRAPAGHPRDTAVAELFPYRGSPEQMRAALMKLEEQFPQLIQVEDIGDSRTKVDEGDGHDIWTVRLTNRDSGNDDKPRALWLMGAHGDEIVNPHLAMRWIEMALKSYGRDPELTTLLDTREIVVVPMINPDGYPNDRYNAAWVDLNRDYRTEDYSSGTPSAQPEPEIAAVMALIEREQPGILVDWHSNGYVVGHGAKRPGVPSPLPEELMEGMTRRFAAFEGYDQVHWGRYGGSSDEYGRDAGIPSLTVETCWVKRPDANGVEEAWQLTAPVMAFSAQIADAPLERAAGPTVGHVMVENRTLYATASEKASGDDRIVAVEWVANTATPPGQGAPLTPHVERLDSSVESVFCVLPKSLDSEMVYVRGQDLHGNWGPLTAIWID